MFYFDTNADPVLTVEYATGMEYGVEKKKEGSCSTLPFPSLLQVAGKPVRLRRSRTGHFVFYFDAYPGASLVLTIETGKVNLTASSLEDAVAIAQYFPQLLRVPSEQTLRVEHTGDSIPDPKWREIVATERSRYMAANFRKSSPLYPVESVPVLSLLRLLPGQLESSEIFAGGSLEATASSECDADDGS